jgi:hypothetical protein
MKNVITSRTIHNRVLASVATFLFMASGMLNAQAGKTYSQLTAEHPGWTQVPGALVSPDCVHQIPNGAKVGASAGRAGEDVTLNGQLIAHYDPCLEASISTRQLVQDPGTGNGWVEASQWNTALKSGDNIDDLYGYWTVPPIPKTYGALVYLFNGVEPSGGAWIMQPVLQFGSNGLFGGDYWVFASWLVHSNQDYFVSSTVLSVNPGDSLSGAVWETSVSGGTLGYDIAATDYTTNQSSLLSLTATGFQWIWAYAGVLEAYNVTSCSEFPKGSSGSLGFTKTHVYHGYPNLDYLKPDFHSAEYNYGGPSCKFKVTVSGSLSTLYF